MNLIIVESPTKARTLTRFLGKDYRVEASMGHIRDLPKSALGVDVVHDFVPTYIIPRDKTKRVNELKEIAKKSDSIILATDPDREGEAIAWHVASLLAERDKRKVKSDKQEKKRQLPSPLSLISYPYHRIVFHEITQHAIKEALNNPRAIDLKLVDAQQARRILDRLVGYKLSPLLWQKLSRRWLSAGRVQSVAVRLIVEREREREKFASQEYWTIEGTFKGVSLQGKEIRAQLVGKDGVKYEKTLTYDLFDGKYTTTSSAISEKREAIRIIEDLKTPFIVSAVDKKEVKRYPAPPYTTSTLQQDAGRRLYFSAKKTMQLAQKLYEEGFITYHRTDSVNLAEKFIHEARSFIDKTYGKAYVPTSPRRYKTKSKVAQEAHEAIRPTDVSALSFKLRAQSSELNHDHVRLYELVWKRAVASQAAEAVFDATTIAITSSNGYRFEAAGSVVKFDGFLRITGREAEEVVILELAHGQAVSLVEVIPTQHTTQPPPRYTEATLVKTLEEKGIGRPSTYAPIIGTIIERHYVNIEEKKLVPTELGFAVTDFLVAHFPAILDLKFTAHMEDDLDSIANGEKPWVPVVAEFYGPFAEQLTTVAKEAQKVKLSEEKLSEPCPQCGNFLVVKMGRYGKFIACTNFPECTYTRQYGEKIEAKCPRCGGDMVIKRSKRGKKFYGCANWPKCTFAAWKKEEIATEQTRNETTEQTRKQNSA